MTKLTRTLLLFLTCISLSQCALFEGSGGSKFRNDANVKNSEIADILRANDPNLSYPVYSSFDEIAPLFRQNDGVTYVVNFWATWCRPCIKEMPFFEQLAEETSSSDVQVILVSLDKPGSVRTKMKEFVEDRPLELPTVAFTDTFYDGWIYKVDAAWQRSTIPVTYIHRNGRTYFNKGQISSYRELTGLLDRVK